MGRCRFYSRCQREAVIVCHGLPFCRVHFRVYIRPYLQAFTDMGLA